MAFCVFGSAVGAKVPQADAERLIASGTATAFRPFGRPPMREWIELRAKSEELDRLQPFLSLAIDHAR